MSGAESLFAATHVQADDGERPVVLTDTEAGEIRFALAQGVGVAEWADDDALAARLVLAYSIVRAAHDKRGRS